MAIAYLQVVRVRELILEYLEFNPEQLYENVGEYYGESILTLVCMSNMCSNLSYSDNCQRYDDIFFFYVKIHSKFNSKNVLS